MTYPELLTAIQTASALRLRVKLQPMYGPGEVIFPSTVAGGKYLISPRRIPGYDESVDCAIIDSVQSQANRMEAALKEEIDRENIALPHVQTDFSEIVGLSKEIGKITCLDAPHRIFDAIIRDSVDDQGTHFPNTEAGEAAILANQANATAIFGISPASLLFGSWDSTGISGGLGEKYTRCVVSELVGVNIESADRAGTRVDPLNIESNQDLVAITEETQDAMLTQLKTSRQKFEKPSRINHSSVIWPDKKTNSIGGVTCDYVQQSTTVSIPALRQLRFLVNDKNADETSTKAQAVLAALALHAIALNVEKGWHLRSRCDLVLDDDQAISLDVLGASNSKSNLDSNASRELLKEAVTQAKNAGLPWGPPIYLKPSAALARLVVDSQRAHRTTTTAAEA